MAHCVRALKQWTGKSNVKTLYDSTVDEFTDQGLFDKVKGKANIALVGFTSEGDVFGGFYHPAVAEQWQDFDDPNIFIFSFESHGRCMTPQRFLVKAEARMWKYVVFFKDDSYTRFVDIGGILTTSSLGTRNRGRGVINCLFPTKALRTTPSQGSLTMETSPAPALLPSSWSK